MNPKFYCCLQRLSTCPFPEPDKSCAPVPIVLRTSPLLVRAQSCRCLSDVPTNGQWTFLVSPTCYVSSQCHAPSFNHINNILWSVQIMQLSVLAPTSKPPPRHSLSLYLAAPSSTPIQNNRWSYTASYFCSLPHLLSQQFSCSVTSCAGREVRVNLKGLRAVLESDHRESEFLYQS